MLKANIGKLDRTLRVVVGGALLLGALMGYGAWMWIGIIPFATGLVGACPLYTILGFGTCPLSKK